MPVIEYSVKIHFPGCQCKYYANKIKNNKCILVSPYNKIDIRKRYFVYQSIDDFLLDKHLYPNNCLCTYTNGIYNGGVVILSNIPTNNFCKFESEELEDIKFYQLKNIKNLSDNSNLINKFCKLFSCIDFMYTIIGKTKQFEIDDNINYTFPKGKIMYDDKNSEECCYREFAEETGRVLDNDIINETYQINRRKETNLTFLPHNIIINNFLLKILLI